MDINKLLPEDITREYRFTTDIPGPCFFHATYGQFDTTTLNLKKCGQLKAAGFPWIEQISSQAVVSDPADEVQATSDDANQPIATRSTRKRKKQ